MKKIDDWKTIFQYSIGALIVTTFIALVIILVFHLAPDGNTTILNVLTGAFASMTFTVVNYFFSSTKSSAEKNEMLFNSEPKNTTDEKV